MPLPPTSNGSCHNSDGEGTPDQTLDALAEALREFPSVIAAKAHREYEADRTRADANGASSGETGWVELIVDGGVLSPAVLRTIANHEAVVAEFIHRNGSDRFGVASLRKLKTEVEMETEAR